MTLTVLGAGAIGSSVARALAAFPDVTTVQVCDLRARALQALTDALPRERLHSFQVDARDLGPLRTILAPSQAVVSCVNSAWNGALARTCVELGIPFLDLGGPSEHLEEVLALDDAARAAGVWVVPNAGLAPGLVNVLAMHGISGFDTVEAALIRIGDIPQAPRPPFHFAAGWSVEKVLDDYLEPVHVLQDGEPATVEALSEVETLTFEGYGTLEAFATQGGLGPMARALEGRVGTLDHKTIRWPGHAAQMRFLIALGLAERTSIDVRTHLTYRDVLLRRLQQHLGSVVPDVLLLRVLVRGTRPGGARETVVYEMDVRHDAADGTNALLRVTGLVAAVMARRLARGEVPGGGAAPPELLGDLDGLLGALGDAGLDVRQTVYPGHRHVAAPATEAA